MTNPKDSVGAKKAPLALVPPALVIGASEAMAVGAKKYGPYNWRMQPVQAMTYAEALLRHLLAWMDGQDEAEDTGIHHWKHIAAGAAIVLDALEANNLIDNRPAGAGPASEMLRKLDKSEPNSEAERVRADVINAGVKMGLIQTAKDIEHEALVQANTVYGKTGMTTGEWRREVERAWAANRQSVPVAAIKAEAMRQAAEEGVLRNGRDEEGVCGECDAGPASEHFITCSHYR